MKQKKKKVLIFVLVLLVSLIRQVCPVMAAGDVVINETNFPDANFRAYVRGFDKNGNNMLDASEANVVEEIRCSERNIASLKGVEHFSNLKRLYCDNNQIQSLDTGQNSYLEVLNCEYNQLTYLDVSRNSWLKTLYCYRNKLTYLDVSRNSWLETLYCYRNKLTSLDLSQNVRLVYLNCSNNQLTALDLSHNPNLSESFTSCEQQVSPVSLYGEWDSGIYTFHLSDILGTNIVNITGISPVTGSDCFDYETGTLKYEENDCAPAIFYYYDVRSPTLRNVTMRVDVTLNYPMVHFGIDGGNGTITADRIYEVAAGDIVTLTISPNSGYELDQLVVQTFYGEQVPVSGKRFTMPADAVYVFASFKPVEPIRIAVFRTGSKPGYSAGETVALAARAEGGKAPYRYQFYVVRSNGAKVILRNYSYTNIFNWIPLTPDTYRVGVNAKDANGKIANQESNVSVTKPLRIAVFRTGYQSSYSPGETVALAARAEDGRAPYRYQFYVIRSNGSRVTLRDYSYTNIFNWKPVTPDTYRVGVNAKDASGTIVNQVKTVTVTKPLKVAVFRAGNKTTYPAGETVALAARGEGGTAPYQYQFYVYRSNGTKVVLKNYSGVNVFNWKPTTPDTYRVCVAIKDAKGKVVTQALYVTVKPK